MPEEASQTAETVRQSAQTGQKSNAAPVVMTGQPERRKKERTQTIPQIDNSYRTQIPVPETGEAAEPVRQPRWMPEEVPQAVETVGHTAPAQTVEQSTPAQTVEQSAPVQTVEQPTPARTSSEYDQTRAATPHRQTPTKHRPDAVPAPQLQQAVQSSSPAPGARRKAATAKTKKQGTQSSGISEQQRFPHESAGTRVAEAHAEEAVAKVTRPRTVTRNEPLNRNTGSD